MEAEIQTQIPGIDHVISEYSVVSMHRLTRKEKGGKLPLCEELLLKIRYLLIFFIEGLSHSCIKDIRSGCGPQRSIPNFGSCADYH